MKELGMALLGSFAIFGFFGLKIYPDLEYSGYSSVGNVALNGTAVEIEQRKQAAAASDEFSSIRSLWAGCAACHGADGGGGIGPMLAGQSSDDIINKLTIYKNNGQIGAQSALMWGQAAMLSEKDIETIGNFIEAGLPGE